MIVMVPFQLKILYVSIFNRKIYKFTAGKGLLNREEDSLCHTKLLTC